MPKTTWSFLAGLLLSCLAATPALADDNRTLTANADPASRPLTLSAVLTRILHDNPQLAAARASVAASAAAAQQAGNLANPELSLEVENFAGRDELRGLDGAETTLRLEQLLELGGKRDKRRAVAAIEHKIAEHTQDMTRAELYARTVAAFTSLLAAQQRLQLTATQEQIATRTSDSIAAQIESGKVPSIAAVRTRPLLVAAQLERARARTALTTAQAALAALLGVETPQTLVVIGDLADLPPATVAAADTPAPQQRLAAAERERAAQELAVAQAQRVPDLTLGLGLRRFAENDETALVAGISLPLPLFDRNRHGIVAASERLEAARQLERHANLELAAAITAAEQEVATTRAAAVALQDELLPAAQQTFEALDYGYRSGKFGLFELLDAQRQLTAVHDELLTAQVACHSAAARRDALLGRLPLPVAGNHP